MVDNDSIIIKYGLIIVAAILILSLFIPIYAYADAPNDTIAWGAVFYGQQIDTGTMATNIYHLLYLTNDTLIPYMISAMIFIIASAAVLVASALTRSRGKVAKILAIIGLGMAITSIGIMIRISGLMSGNWVGLFYFDLQGTSNPITLPHVGWYLLVGGLIFGALTCKKTDWEALK